jgi:hypothetical protein
LPVSLANGAQDAVVTAASSQRPLPFVIGHPNFKIEFVDNKTTLSSPQTVAVAFQTSCASHLLALADAILRFGHLILFSYFASSLLFTIPFILFCYRVHFQLASNFLIFWFPFVTTLFVHTYHLPTLNTVRIYDC